MEYWSISEKVKAAIKSTQRFTHSQNVAIEAAKLARHYGEDEEAAKIAGILHDCAKEIPPERAIELFTKFGIVIDDITLNTPKLIHAPLGACIAQYEYGITDTRILDAIWFHTTAKSNMTLLTKILYVADFIEPEREFEGVEQLRLIAYGDLDAAVMDGLNWTLNDVLKEGKLIHPDTVHARNFLLAQKK